MVIASRWLPHFQGTNSVFKNSPRNNSINFMKIVNVSVAQWSVEFEFEPHFESTLVSHISILVNNCYTSSFSSLNSVESTEFVKYFCEKWYSNQLSFA